MASAALPAITFSVAFTGTRAGQTVSADPNDPTVTPIWTDLTHRLVALGAKRGKSYELDQATAQEQSFTLRNTDGALDPTNTQSPFYPWVLPYRACRLQVTWIGVTYTVFTGFIESWPQTWKLHGAYGYVTCLAVYAIAVLSQMIMTSCLAAEVLLDNPLAYWPLTEPNAATQGGQIAADGEPNLSAVQYGTGGSYQFGGTTLTTLLGAGASDGTSGPIAGDTTGLQLTPVSGGNGIGFSAGIGPQTSTAFTIECWVQTTAVSCTILGLYGGGLTAARLTIDAAGHLGGSSYLAAVTSTANVHDGQLHHVAFTVAWNGTSYLYMDGNQVGTGSPGSQIIPDAFSVGGADTAAGGTLGAMTVAHAAVYTSALSLARIADHYTAGVTAFSGEDSGARFSRILAYGPWNGPSTVPAGLSILQGCYALAGKSVAAALLDTVAAEQGNMYIDNLGAVISENRHSRYLQLTDIWTFGENQTAVSHPARANLCSNPSFETSLAGYTVGGGVKPTITLSTAQASAGVQSMLITWGTGGFLPLVQFSFASTPGLVYTVSVNVFVPTGNPNLLLAGPGSVFSPSSGLNNQWQRISLTLTATASSTSISIWPGVAPTAGQLAYVDAILIEQSGTVGTYFDGSSTGPDYTYAWTGTPNLSTATATPVSTSGEMPYLGDVEVGFDPQQVYNVVVVQRPAGIVATARDNTSLLRYFPRAFPTTPIVLPVTTDDVVIDAAQYLVGRYKDPHARVSAVVFEPTSNPDLWPFCLSVQIGQRVRLNRRPPNAPAMSIGLFVESVGHDYDAKAGTWHTTLECSPAFWQNYSILTAARAPLNASRTAGQTSIVVNVPADLAGNAPAQNGWTPTAIPSVQINDGANSETVAVSNMTYAGQLVTITVAALAHNHAAGVIISEPDGPYTYNQFDAAAVLDGQHSLGY